MITLEKYKNHKICKFTKNDDLGIYKNMSDVLIIVTPDKEEIIDNIFDIQEAKDYIDKIV